MSGWAQHIDDLAAATAALLVEGPSRPQPLVDARAAIAARDAVLVELRALVGAVSDVPQMGEVRELTVFDIVHRSGQALHQALSELPRAVRFGSAEPTASDDRKLPAYEQFWRRAAHATIGLEGYVDALNRLPDHHAWNVLRDLADVAAAIPYLDHDLSEALCPELTSGEDLSASYAQLTHPGHDALRLAAGEVRARVAPTEPPIVGSRASTEVGGKQFQISPGQVGEAMTRYAHAVSARGATLSVPDLRSVTRVLEAGCASATQILERSAPVVPGASAAATGLRAVSDLAKRLREAPAKSMTVAHLELLRDGRELQGQMEVVAVPAVRLPGGATDVELRRLAWPAVQFAEGVPALARALESSVREAVGNGLMLVPSVGDRSNPTRLAWVTSTMGPEREGPPVAEDRHRVRVPSRVTGVTEDLRLAAEQLARAQIDKQLTLAGWSVTDRSGLNPFVPSAVREVIMKSGHGRADYALYLNKEVVGVIEAKPEGTTLSGVEWQSAMYAAGLPATARVRLVGGKVSFVFEANGSETHLTNGYDPLHRARRYFGFPRPETLARWIRDAEQAPEAATWRAQVQHMPVLLTEALRPAQISAITGIEHSLAEQQHSRSLVQMATGAGKTFTAVTESYRLLKHGGFHRILFLVDRNNLADQTMREFRDYTTPDDGRKFTELYNVDKLTSAGMVGSSKVVISTIQRVFKVLTGADVSDQDDPGLDGAVPDAPVTVSYSPELPPEAFDLIIVDECHRSIYGSWRGVLEYFDAHVIGLTATPVKQTFGFFEQNLVSEYTYAESVADGVNVDFDVYRIKTQISDQGSTVEAGTIVPKRDRRTRLQRLEALDDDFTYTSGQLDRAVTATDQIRTVLETFRDKLFTEIFPWPLYCPQDADRRQGRQPRGGDRHPDPAGLRQGQRLRRQDHLQRQGPPRSRSVRQTPQHETFTNTWFGGGGTSRSTRFTGDDESSPG